MSAANAPNPESGSVQNEREWLASRLSATPIPHYQPSRQSHAAARVIGFAVAVLVFAGAIGGGLYYLKKHPVVMQREAARVLPRSGQSPSAYRYLNAPTRRSRARAFSGTSASASAGTVTIEDGGFTLASDEFLAEVIDGDRHYFIRFHRVPPVVVATKEPSTVVASAPAPASSGENVYLSKNGWWNLTRAPHPTAPGANSAAASVVLDVFLTPDGHVDRAQVLSGATQMAAAAVEAVKKWHYDAPSSGAPARRRVVVNFSVSPQ